MSKDPEVPEPEGVQTLQAIHMAGFSTVGLRCTGHGPGPKIREWVWDGCCRLCKSWEEVGT